MIPKLKKLPPMTEEQKRQRAELLRKWFEAWPEVPQVTRDDLFIRNRGESCQ